VGGSLCSGGGCARKVSPSLIRHQRLIGGGRGAQILEIHNDAEGGSHREAHIARSLSPRGDERVLLTPQSPTADGARVCWNWEPFNSRAHYECRDFAAGSDPRPGPSSGTVVSLCPLGPQTGATWDWTLDTGLGWALRCFCAFSSVSLQCTAGWWLVVVPQSEHEWMSGLVGRENECFTAAKGNPPGGPAPEREARPRGLTQTKQARQFIIWINVVVVVVVRRDCKRRRRRWEQCLVKPRDGHRAFARRLSGGPLACGLSRSGCLTVMGGR